MVSGICFKLLQQGGKKKGEEKIDDVNVVKY